LGQLGWCGSSLSSEAAENHGVAWGPGVGPAVPASPWFAILNVLVVGMARVAELYLGLKPKQQRYVMHSLAVGIIFVGVIFVPAPAHAQWAGGLDSAAQEFQSIGTGWMGNAASLAAGLSGLALTAMFAYRVAQLVADARGDFRAAQPHLYRLVLDSALPFYIVTVAVLPALSGVIGLANALGARLGITVQTSPDAVFSQGFNAAWTAFQNIVTGYVNGTIQNALNLPPCTGNAIQVAMCNVGEWSERGAILAASAKNLDMVVLIAGIFAGIMIYCFALLAAELLVAIAVTSLTLPLAAWTIGFTGTVGESHAHAWGAILAAVNRYLVVGALCVVAGTIASRFTSGLGTALAPPPPSNLQTGVALLTNFGWFRPLLTAAIGCWILTKLAQKASDMAESIVSGRGIISGAASAHQAAASTANTVGGVVVGGATGGLSGAALGGMQGTKGAASSAAMRARMRK
jgi:hypothetical protein